MPHDLIVTVVNHAFATSGLCANWMQSLRNVGLEGRTLIFTTDEDGYQLLLREEFPVWLWRPKVPTPTWASDYGSDAFRKISFDKLRVVSELLSCDKRILFSDVDVVFLKDPLSDIIAHEEEIIFQSDSPWQCLHEKDASQSACTGFYYARPTDQVKALFRVPEDVPNRHRNDQEFVRAKLSDFGGVQKPISGLLARELYPNGSFWNHHHPLDPYIIHFNWCVGVESKKRSIVDNGCWFLKKDRAKAAPFN